MNEGAGLPPVRQASIAVFGLLIGIAGCSNGIHRAAEVGDVKVLQRYIKNDGDPNARNSEGIPILTTASLNGQLEFVTELLDAGANVNSTDAKVGSALHGAAHYGSKALVLHLLKQGANVNAIGPDDETPIWYAIRSFDPSIAIDLLNAGADPNACWESGDSPLHMAASSGYDDVVVALIKAGATIDKVENRKWRTPLHSAVINDQPSTIRHLLQAGADCEKRDKQQMDAVELAHQYKCRKSIEALSNRRLGPTSSSKD